MSVLSPLIDIASISLSTVLAEDMRRASIQIAELSQWLYPFGDRFEVHPKTYLLFLQFSVSALLAPSYLGFVCCIVSLCLLLFAVQRADRWVSVYQCFVLWPSCCKIENKKKRKFAFFLLSPNMSPVFVKESLSQHIPIFLNLHWIRSAR